MRGGARHCAPGPSLACEPSVGEQYLQAGQFYRLENILRRLAQWGAQIGGDGQEGSRVRGWPFLPAAPPGQPCRTWAPVPPDPGRPEASPPHCCLPPAWSLSRDRPVPSVACVCASLSCRDLALSSLPPPTAMSRPAGQGGWGLPCPWHSLGAPPYGRGSGNR